MQDYRVLDGDRGYRYLASEYGQESSYTAHKWTLLALSVASAIYLLIKHLDLALLSPLEIIWSAIVFLVPTSLVNLLARWTKFDATGIVTSDAANGSEARAMKSQALRQILGFQHGLSGSRSIGLQALRPTPPPAVRKNFSKVPAGLGNWDNSCYQNSVLQGLSALPSFKQYLATSSDSLEHDTTTSSLYTLTQNLMSTENNGRHIWTPAKLKSMSSWQQQDAQEYFSRVLDDIEKDAKRQAVLHKDIHGLEQVRDSGAETYKLHGPAQRVNTNPLEGLLAQRVACVNCGFSEGLTLLPFNCLTVSLGHDRQYTLQDRLDDYTKLEEIEGVECISCTLRRQQTRLQTLVTSSIVAEQDESSTFTKQSPDFLDTVASRLKEVQSRIEDHDFTDQALKKCAIAANAKVTTTKTKQVVVARAPQSLAIHVNRSIFDEMTGALRKNPAFVSYPKHLTFNAWTLGQQDVTDAEGVESWSMAPRISMVSQEAPVSAPQVVYVLRSIVTHYGRHENGHYVCFRQHNTGTDIDGAVKDTLAADSGITKKEVVEQWWRLSDEDVMKVTEEEVLDQAGVFMLFYERVDHQVESSTRASAEAQVATTSTPIADANGAAPAHEADATDDGMTDLTSEDDKLDITEEQAIVKTMPVPEKSEDTEPDTLLPSTMEQPKGTRPQSFQPQKLRTSRNRGRKSSTGFSPTMRAVTAQ